MAVQGIVVMIAADCRDGVVGKHVLAAGRECAGIVEEQFPLTLAGGGVGDVTG